MTWSASEDGAWHQVKPDSWRHYTGIELSQLESCWMLTDNETGNASYHSTSKEAIESINRKRFWKLGDYDEFAIDYGDSRHTFDKCMSLGGPSFFTFWVPYPKDFPQFVKSTLTKYWFGEARCAGCDAPMNSIQVRAVRSFDGKENLHRMYIVCDCDYAVWQMSWDSYLTRDMRMRQYRSNWNRKQTLIEAGGEHTKADIKHIMFAQNGRCVYCDKPFSEELACTTDHLLPVTYGGGDWALNIVLACGTCNKRRGNVPFRTYCTLLSKEQNNRIIKHLGRRIDELELSTIAEDALRCLDKALRIHDPNNHRFCLIMEQSKRRHGKVKTTRLLPVGALAVLRRYDRLLK